MWGFGGRQSAAATRCALCVWGQKRGDLAKDEDGDWAEIGGGGGGESGGGGEGRDTADISRNAAPKARGEKWKPEMLLPSPVEMGHQWASHPGNGCKCDESLFSSVCVLCVSDLQRRRESSETFEWNGLKDCSGVEVKVEWKMGGGAGGGANIRCHVLPNAQ